MGIKNLTRIDPYGPPIPNTSYFYPLSLTLDPEEKARFITFFEKTYKQDVGDQPLYSPLANAVGHFPKTVERTDKFLKPLGLIVRNFTLFTGAGNSEGKNIHVDGCKLEDGKTDVVLEARLSYYEMAEAPGVIRWFPKTEEYTKFTRNSPGKMMATHWLLPWIEDLKSGKLTWETCPDYEFATPSTVPSAILRTNVPHHVMQGPGVRLTVSAQLIWADTKSPVGVWEHIVKNFHLLDTGS